MQHEGKDISAWHDVPLQNEDGSFNFVCEIPKETAAKMEVATVRPMTPRCMLAGTHLAVFVMSLLCVSSAIWLKGPCMHQRHNSAHKEEEDYNQADLWHDTLLTVLVPLR